jgi:lipopolysaccharide transport system ATP-binding protein
MSDVVIQAENLSKLYRIGEVRRGYATARERIRDGLTSLWRRRRRRTAGPRSVWVLQDVSFEVKEGEALGIIGRNGAGKSTLLKILSRITEPTRGRATIRGRVGSLLEFGTGFHPELTGRENIYLNGAILGMRKAEIDRKFDEIVAFAEVATFIDTPVKHYSTGMHVRLAFAVAAHLEPEVMIIDEVLAVGDMAFQNKCLGKMEDVARQGRTVLFVSHNMGAIRNLCTSAMVLEGGRIAMHGGVDDAIAAYTKSVTGTSQGEARRWKDHGTGDGRIIDARLLDVAGQPQTTFRMGETLVVEFDVELARSFRGLDMSIHVKQAETGLEILHLLNHDGGFMFEQLPAGKHRFTVRIPDCLLYPGYYKISLWLVGARVALDHVQDVLAFYMVDGGCSRRTLPFSPHLGVYHSPSHWEQTAL